MTDRQPRRWTSAEDQILREQVDAQQIQGVGRDWCQVALALPGRTNKDCRKRWHNSVAEGLRKGQWSKSEDQLLIHGVHRYGSQWTKVATCVSTRSADQCAKRWQQSLDPRLDRSEWRENEDTALLAAVNRLGRHWKDIQEEYLPHRSKNCVKNRYSVLSRRNPTQLMTYDDSVESSSSSPGTPLSLEVSSSVAYAPAPTWYNTTQRSYGQPQYPYADNNGAVPTWAGSSNPSDFLASMYPAFDSASAMEYHPSVDPSRVLSSNTSDCSYLHTAMSMQQPLQDLAGPPLEFDAYSHLAQQQPYGSATIPCATLLAQAHNQYGPSSAFSRRYSPQVQPSSYGEDSAPYGWHQQ